MRLFAVSEKDAGRTVQLEKTITRSVPFTMKVPFGVIKGNIAEEDLLFFNIANGLVAGFRILVVDGPGGP